MKATILLILALVSGAVYAADTVYMQSDPDGNVSFSDTPQGDAQPVALPQISVTNTQQPAQPKPVVNVKQGSQVALPAGNIPYSIFTMDSPVDQESIQNQPSVNIELKMDPPLQAGDKVQVFLDGAPWGPPAPATHFVFNAPDRGTHTLSAKIVNMDGEVVKETVPITVFVHQAHNGGAP